MVLEATNTNYLKVYDQGFLNYALNCMMEQGSFEEYSFWLKTQPCMTFTNNLEWFKDGDSIVYESDEEGSIAHDISAKITFGDETIYHSIEAGNSWFFLKTKTDRLVALYVD